MMQILSNVSLRRYNTFGFEAEADWLVEIREREDLPAFFQDPRFAGLPVRVLGGGSNVIVLERFRGVVLRLLMDQITIENETEDWVELRVESGRVWHSLVLESVARGWGGLENLALIPGTVGAAPIQNIGAYGAELKDVFVKLEAYAPETRQWLIFDADACRFGYRESVFKQEWKDRCVIASVTLRLSKKPVLRLDYGALRQELAACAAEPYSVADVCQAVCRIRQSKLPDPAVVGNAGSFFKNPVVNVALFEAIKAKHPAAPHYPAEEGKVKLAAGWLVEQCGWKGRRNGAVGVHPLQALVLVNYGGGTGQELLALANQIRQSVLDAFGVELEQEPLVFGG